MFFNCTSTVPMLVQSKISLNVRQWKTSSFLKHIVRANKSVILCNKQYNFSCIMNIKKKFLVTEQWWLFTHVQNAFMNYYVVRLLVIIPSPTKLRRDIVTLPSIHLSFLPSVLPSVHPSFRNILVNTLESTSFNGFWLNLVHT